MSHPRHKDFDSPAKNRMTKRGVMGRPAVKTKTRKVVKRAAKIGGYSKKA